MVPAVISAEDACNIQTKQVQMLPSESAEQTSFQELTLLSFPRKQLTVYNPRSGKSQDATTPMPHSMRESSRTVAMNVVEGGRMGGDTEGKEDAEGDECVFET